MTNEDEIFEEQQLALGGVGQKLREARERAGMELSQISAELRISERHLKVIEDGNFEALPARTYAIGFSRSYARLVGLDEKMVAAEVREEMAARGHRPGDRPVQLEPGDPARIPSRGLAWTSLAAVVLLVVGGFSFYRSYFLPGVGPRPLIEAQAPTKPVAAPSQAAVATPDAKATQGPVVFTALEPGVWAKFYDGAGKRLFEKQMAQGESFTVPSDAQDPRIWTGRPDAFAITIGGRRVPRLAEEERVVRDVAIDASSLLARAEPSPAAPAAAVDNSAT